VGRGAKALVATAVALVAGVVGISAPVAADPDQLPPPAYLPPTAAPVLDGFRPPPAPWTAGNRGIDFATAAGSPVTAAADGEVVFVGPVAGSMHVVLLHADGLRTSYSFLATAVVRRGDRVAGGAVVGFAAGPLHFGVRAGDVYLDPADVLARAAQVHLVPETQRRPASAGAERSALARFLRSSAGQAAAGAAAVWSWSRDQASQTLDEARGLAHYAWEATPVPRTYRLAAGIADWSRRRASCTPPHVVPPRLAERRLAVLVAGLGSSSSSAAIDEVDTAALGYAGDDVVRFSYRGGTVRERPYGPADTTVDLRVSARRLRELLTRLAASHPGVAIDVIAHSQGGVVAHAALTDEGDGLDPRLPSVRTLVTLASPHRGSDVATAVAMVGHSTTGESAERVLSAVLDNGIAPDSPAMRQLAETSEFMRRLRDRPLPPGLRATSIAARGDLLVAAGRTRLPGASSITLDIPGLVSDHSELPGSPEARREIALGLAGLAPTCEDLSDALADLVVADTIGWTEDMAGAGLWYGGRRIDAASAGKAPSKVPPGPRPRPALVTRGAI